jgi:hypothetical protein
MLPNRFIVRQKRLLLLLRQGDSFHATDRPTLINEEHRACLLVIMMSLLTISHACMHTRLHGTCTHAYGAPARLNPKPPCSRHHMYRPPASRPAASPITTSRPNQASMCFSDPYSFSTDDVTQGSATAAREDQPRVEDHAGFYKDVSVILESCSFYPAPCRARRCSSERGESRPGLPSALPLM